GSLVYAVGNDWDAAIARTVPSDQSIVHQRVDALVADTFWVQTTSSVTLADSAIQINDTAPLNDRWNMAAVEVLPIPPGPQTAIVPDVVNQPQSNAVQAISGAGLTGGPITSAPSTVVPAGVVISQNPAAGTQVAAATAAALGGSSWPPPVTGPNLLRQTQAP